MSLIKKIIKGEDVSNYGCKTRLEHLLKKKHCGESCDDVEAVTDIEKLVKCMGAGGGKRLVNLSGATVKFKREVFENTELFSSLLNEFFNKIVKADGGLGGDSGSKDVGIYTVDGNTASLCAYIDDVGSGNFVVSRFYIVYWTSKYNEIPLWDKENGVTDNSIFEMTLQLDSRFEYNLSNNEFIKFILAIADVEGGIYE